MTVVRSDFTRSFARSFARSCAIFCLSFWSMLSFAVGTIAITDIKTVQLGNRAFEVQVVTSKPIEVKDFVLTNPHRAAFDLVDAHLDGKTRLHLMQTEKLQGIRLVQHPAKAGRPGYTRIVADVTNAVTVEHTSLTSVTATRNIWKVQWAQAPVEEEQVLTNSANSPDLPDSAIPVINQPVVDTTDVSNDRHWSRTKVISDIVVVLDPGHGGKDPGAISAKGHQEKTIVLAVAKQLESLLNPIQGYQVVASRAVDTFVSLGTRQRLARKQHGHLLMSLHADSAPSVASKARGASVYTLNHEGASSEFARLLADHANTSADELQLGRVNLNEIEGSSAELLISMQQRQISPKNTKVASYVLKALSEVSRLHKKQPGNANFAVLRLADVPAVLVELGFLSNRRDAAKLSTSDYQHELALALLRAIHSYFTSNPPRDTMLGAYQDGAGLPDQIKNYLPYVIQSGDTLTSIAKRYQVKVRQLEQANSNHKTLQVGTILLIPFPSLKL